MRMNFTSFSLKPAIAIIYLLLCFLPSIAQQPAFPGAEGAGMFATGGRGTTSTLTTVFEVTNLSDDGLPGSLRYALTASATYRTVVFRVSGTIHLNSRLTIKANTTIAGQTAPGDGICVADHPVYIVGDNVIVRYMRFRLGDKNQKKVDANGNPVNGSGGDDAFGGADVSNIIIDHCSVSWSNDEALTIYRGDNLTIQWCFITEPLNYSYHWETGDTDWEQHGYGGIWGAKRGSMHHNLFTHCKNRTPRFAGVASYTPAVQGAEMADFRNNVIYNWGINNIYGGEGGYYNVVNNYLKPGPSTTSRKTQIVSVDSGGGYPYAKYYLAGNYITSSATNSNNNWSGVTMRSGKLSDTVYSKVNTPFDFGYPVETQSALEAYEAVLQGAGCSLPNRDTLDQRIVNDVRNGTGRIIDVQGGYPHGTPYEQTVNAWPALNSTAAPADSDHDGMPDTWETNNGLNPNDASDRNGVAANGYTNLENYLNSLTNPVANTSPTIYANGSFSNFNQTLGSPSAVQRFLVSGNNLSSDIILTAPANYQLSLDSATWSSSLTLTANSGSVSSTTVRVRLNAPANGTYNGNISAASTGATTINMPVNGTTSNAVAPAVNQKQIIGLFPEMEGGFENQPAGAVSTAAPAAGSNLSQKVWTTNGSANIVSNGTARTGNNYFTYTSTSLSTKNNYSPTVSTPLTKGIKYIVQFYYRAPAPSTGNQVGGLIAIADNTNFTTATSTAAWTATNGDWLKAAYTYSVNPAYTPTMSFAGFRFNGGGTNAIAKPFDVDDFVIYPADNQTIPSADVTAPDAASSPVATGHPNSITVSWTAPATGVDGGGYVVVRSTSSAAPVLKANGLYFIGNSIGSGNTVVYIGSSTNFTDDGSVAALAPGITYHYNIFTVDKAFNYSSVATASAATVSTIPVVSMSGNLNPFTQTLGMPSASQSFTVHGNNLTANVRISAPAGFELSEDDNTWHTSLSLVRENNSVDATAFVRLNATTAGLYSGNITATSSGATDASLAVTGVAATAPLPVAGYDVVVAQDGTGNYTSLQAAINAAPSNRTTPYRIFVKKGKYIEKVTIPSNKPFLYVVGEGINEVVFSWDDYAGKPGVTEIATITINSNDCVFMNMTIENSWGRKNDGPQALAVKATGDRIIFKNCKMVSGQDTVMAQGNGKRQYFRNCYIDGNTDYIYGSAIAVFDSCVLFNRDRLDGSSSSVFTAASTPPGQTYGYVFRDCFLPNNNGQTTYTLGRPWGNAAPPHTSETKVVFLNCRMGTTVKPERWQVWTPETNTSLITYAEYKTRYFSGALVDLSKRVSWSKEFTDEQAAPYFVNSNMFGTWDPCAVLAEACTPFSAPISLSNFRMNRSSSQSNILFNICWPINGVTFELHRSTDSVNFSKVNELVASTDTTAAYRFTDVLPPAGVSYFYKIVAGKAGYQAFTTDTVVKVDRSTPLNGDFRSAGSGFWTNASSGNGSNSVSIWEKYVTASNSWVLQAKGVQPSNANVTIRSGHTVTMDGLKSVNNLTIEQGAVLNSNGGYATPVAQTLRIGAGQAASVTFQNDGTFGGDANPQDLIILEFNPACASVLWTGSGVSKITRLRPLPANPNALNVVFDQDVSLSYSLPGFTAYYNTASNTTGENVTYTINKGKTIKLVNPTASFSPTSSATANPGGSYTYNIEGTLDLSVTTATSNLVPYSNNASSVVSLNIGSEGVLKLGKGFNTVNSSPSTTGNNGKLVLTIADGGLVDATKTTSLSLGSNYFITSGSGALKRSVGASAVSFPIGTSATSYNPVTLTNTGAVDNFSVSVKNSFDNAAPDANKVVNKQWTINEDADGGSNLTAKFGWVVADHASGFDPAQPLAVMQYKESNWKITAAPLSGSGTLSDPYTASASGFTTVGAFGVTNYTKANATLKIEAGNYTYDGNAHAASGFAYGTGGEGDRLSPDVTFTYKDAGNNSLSGTPKNAGTYTVTASFAGNDYYNPASSTATLTIDPRPLTIKANDQTKECGTAPDLGTTAFTADGLVDGDAVSSVSLTANGVTGPGEYPIVTGSAVGTGLSNYTITYVNGTLTITDVTAPIITYCPVVPVQCYNANGAYSIPVLTATDNCGTINISYSITGATSRSGIGADASGSFNEGVSTINWIINDGHGNQTTCQTTVTGNPRLLVSIPDVYAMNPAVDAKNTLYLGYGPSSLNITANASGGTAAYTYSWSNGQSTQSNSVDEAGTYTVLVKDANQCTAQASITIVVTDVRCGNNSDKVMVCHNGKEICVTSGSVQEHLDHGDHLGGCNMNSSSASRTNIQNDTSYSYQVMVYPNPVSENLKVHVSKIEAGATMQLYNANGSLVRSLKLVRNTNTISVEGLTAGMYYLVVRNGDQTTTNKIVIQ